MKYFYRVGNPLSEQGLWYSPDGVYTGLIHNAYNFCASSELQMPYDEDLVGWLSATESLEELLQWFPAKDLKALAKHGFVVLKYGVWEGDYRMYTGDHGLSHWVIKKATSRVVAVDVLCHGEKGVFAVSPISVYSLITAGKLYPVIKDNGQYFRFIDDRGAPYEAFWKGSGIIGNRDWQRVEQ